MGNKFKVGDKVKIKKEIQCKSSLCPCSSLEPAIIEHINIWDDGYVEVILLWKIENRTLNVNINQIEPFFQTQSQRLNEKI